MIVLIFFYCLYFFISPISLLALPGARLIPFLRPYCTTTKIVYAPARRQGGNYIFLLVTLARHAFWQYSFFHFHETRPVTELIYCYMLVYLLWNIIQKYFLGESNYKHRSELSYKVGSAGIPSPFILTSYVISPPCQCSPRWTHRGDSLL